MAERRGVPLLVYVPDDMKAEIRSLADGDHPARRGGPPLTMRAVVMVLLHHGLSELREHPLPGLGAPLDQAVSDRLGVPLGDDP
jgi:hypothetical protein